MSIKLYLFDIEGTTTDIKFVHQVLFPYSQQRLESYVLNHQTDSAVEKALEEVRKTVWLEEQRKLGLHEVIAQLKAWIKADRKHGALKELQGLVWDEGYALGDFKGHLYPDVKPFFEKIKASGLQIGIYSSGSVHAQQLIFRNSEYGDLTSMITYYFDTKVGGKREKQSYLTIAEETEMKAPEIMFYSDIKEELQAAASAGFQVTQLLRPGTAACEFPGIPHF
jgi:enolase-phosphatase E1